MGRSGMGNENDRRGERHQETYERRVNNRNWDRRNSMNSDRDHHMNMRGPIDDSRTGTGRIVRSSMTRTDESQSYYSDDRQKSVDNRGNARSSRKPTGQNIRVTDFNSDRGGYQRPKDMTSGFRDTRNDSDFHTFDSQKQETTSRGYDVEQSYNKGDRESSRNDASSKRSYDDYQKQHAPSRGYDIEPAYAKRR